MEKVDSLIDYFFSTRANYFNYMSYVYNDDSLRGYILENNYISGAKLSLISLIMLSVKEDLVENIGDLKFKSKLFFKSLEESINLIAINKNDKYYLDGYEFLEAPSVVSLIRNKLAHGKYVIDFNNNNVILNHNDVDIRINIDKLSVFIINAFNKYLTDIKTQDYVRDFCSCNKVPVNRDVPLKTVVDIKNIIRNITYYKFDLSTKDEYIPKICKKEFDNFVKYYKDNINSNKTYQLYKNIEEFLKTFGCSIKLNVKKGCSKDVEERLIEYAKATIIGVEGLTYDDQVKLLINEFLRIHSEQTNRLDPLLSYTKLLIVLDAMKQLKTTDKDRISKFMDNNGYNNMYINYNEIGCSLISMFNSLFMYGFDDIYSFSGGYKLDRIDAFDFSILDMDYINPIVDGIDYSPIIDSKARYNAVENKYNSILNKINKNNENLSKVSDENIKIKITNIIDNLNNELTSLELIKNKEKNNYLDIVKDYTDNYKYFKNYSIINGIRNSIAHGHYVIVSDSDLASSKIIFSDIYNGKLTFKVELTFYEFSSLIEDNFKIILDYVDNKISDKNSIKK